MAIERDIGPLAQACAEQVRAIMGQKHLTQDALAQILERSQAYISSRVNGKEPFDLDDIEGLAHLVGEEPFEMLARIVARAREDEERRPHPGRSVAERRAVAARRSEIKSQPSGQRRSKSG